MKTIEIVISNSNPLESGRISTRTKEGKIGRNKIAVDCREPPSPKRRQGNKSGRKKITNKTSSQYQTTLDRNCARYKARSTAIRERDEKISKLESEKADLKRENTILLGIIEKCRLVLATETNTEEKLNEEPVGSVVSKKRKQNRASKIEGKIEPQKHGPKTSVTDLGTSNDPGNSTKF